MFPPQRTSSLPRLKLFSWVTDSCHFITLRNLGGACVHPWAIKTKKGPGEILVAWQSDIALTAADHSPPTYILTTYLQAGRSVKGKKVNPFKNICIHILCCVESPARYLRLTISHPVSLYTLTQNASQFTNFLCGSLFINHEK
jgi:hypothetical protein